MKDAVGYYVITNFGGMKKNIITLMMLILVMEFFYVVYELQFFNYSERWIRLF